MTKFLQELEASLAKMPPGKRAEVGEAYRRLASAISSSTTIITGNGFRPSTTATLGMLMELGGALRGPGLIAKLKALAPKIGPNVDALVRAL